MPKLIDIKTGSTARITNVSGDDRFVSRVTAIGLTQGCPVEIIQNAKNRPVLLYARDSSIALDRNDCTHIEAEVVS